MGLHSSSEAPLDAVRRTLNESLGGCSRLSTRERNPGRRIPAEASVTRGIHVHNLRRRAGTPREQWRFARPLPP